MTEEEILKKIDEVNINLQDAHVRLVFCKKQVTDAETDYLGFKLTKERLLEDLRVLRNESVNEEITERDKDIERFKKVLPSILESDKWISKKETK